MKHAVSALNAVYAQADKLFAEVYRGRELVPVYSEGSHTAKIILVGEAPGEQETLQRRPFVGLAGKNLNELLLSIGRMREELFITNVVKFRPYNLSERTGRRVNRPPTTEEIAICAFILKAELEIVKPKVIVTLGNTALHAVTGDKKLTMGQVHGQCITADGHTVFPLYHPASIIYNKSLKSVYEEDGQKLREYMDLSGL